MRVIPPGTTLFVLRSVFHLLVFPSAYPLLPSMASPDYTDCRNEITPDFKLFSMSTFPLSWAFHKLLTVCCFLPSAFCLFFSPQACFLYCSSLCLLFPPTAFGFRLLAFSFSSLVHHLSFFIPFCLLLTASSVLCRPSSIVHRFGLGLHCAVLSGKDVPCP